MTLRTRIAPLLVLLVASGCTTTPRADLDAYLEASNEVYAITNNVFDIVAPYERGVVRRMALVDPATSTTPSEIEALRELAADPATVDAAFAGSDAMGLESCIGRTGEGRYCYPLRDAYATLGDPPLVAALRRTADAVWRYDRILAAYAQGVSSALLVADLQRLKSRIDAGLALSDTAAPAVPGALTAAFAALGPIAAEVGAQRDRAALGQLLLRHQPAVDSAYVAMAMASTELFNNVYVDMNNRIVARPEERAALLRRRDEIRSVIANWTVLLDDTRILLAELKIAVESPQALEPRLREMGVLSIRALGRTSVVRNQIDTLGEPRP